jgi:hypothetical protein
MSSSLLLMRAPAVKRWMADQTEKRSQPILNPHSSPEPPSTSTEPQKIMATGSLSLRTTRPSGQTALTTGPGQGARMGCGLNNFGASIGVGMWAWLWMTLALGLLAPVGALMPLHASRCDVRMSTLPKKKVRLKFNLL